MRRSGGLHHAADPMLERRSAARWFAIGLWVAPGLDTADDAGVLTAPASLDAQTWLLVIARLSVFAGIAAAAAALLARHAQRDRTWFFVACAGLSLAYVIHGGLRASGIAAIVVLALAFVRLRLLPEEPR